MGSFWDLDMKDYPWYCRANVLVTGASGFVGYRLVETLLETGANVSVILRDIDFTSPFLKGTFKGFMANQVEKTICGDIRDYETCERAIAETMPEYIFHLAAVTQVVDARRMPLQTFQSNIAGTAHILEAARRIAPKQIKIVSASSDKAYGEPTEMPLNEFSPLNPIHPYDVSKASADFIARCYALYYEELVCVTRCGNIYGPYDTNWQRLIPGAIRAALSGEVLDIRSDGKQVREYNYIDDIVDAYLLAGQSLQNKRFNGISWTISDEDARLGVLQLVDIIKNCLNLPLEYRVLDRAKDETKELILDSSMIRNELGWEPAVDIYEGIGRTADWMRSYLQSRYVLEPPMMRWEGRDD